MDNVDGQIIWEMEDLIGGDWAYSTIPAELMTMSMEPQSAVTFAVTSAIAFSSRTSTL